MYRSLTTSVLLCLYGVFSYGAVINTNCTWTTISPIFQQSQLVGNYLYDHANGCKHTALIYSTLDETPQTVFDCCMTSNLVKRIVIGGGKCTLSGFTPMTNGLCAVSSEVVSSYYSYDPHSGVTNRLGTPSGYGGYSSTIGSDGNLYFGNYGYGMVDWYDVASSTLYAVGKVDQDAVSATYAYRVGGDSEYIYASLRANAGWYLGVYSKTFGTNGIWWKSDGATVVDLYHGASDGLWYVRKYVSPNYSWWKLEGGAPVALGSPPDILEDHKYSGANNDTEYWDDDGWDVLLSSAVFNTFNTNGVISYRIYGSEEPYTDADMLGTPSLVDAYYSCVVAASATEMLVVGLNYGPLTMFNYRTFSSEYLGQAPFAIYSAVPYGDGTWILSGYHKATLRYNPELEWNVFVVADANTNSNPALLNGQWGQYHYYPAIADDGTVFTASEYSRDLTGAHLGWSDPATGYSSSNRVDFASYYSRDLKSIDQGSILLFGATDGTLISIKASDSSISGVTNFGAGSLYKIATHGSNAVAICAYTNLIGFDSQLNLKYSNNIPLQAWGGSSGIPRSLQRVYVDLDGYAWITAGGTTIYRIEIASGQYFVSGFTEGNYNVTMSSDNEVLFLYSGDSTVVKMSDDIIRRNRLLNSTTVRAGSVTTP